MKSPTCWLNPRRLIGRNQPYLRGVQFFKMLRVGLALLIPIALLSGCGLPLNAKAHANLPPLTPNQRLARHAEQQIGVTVRYDPSYAQLIYPGGDVPLDRGVCTDVVIRALRRQGVDLQKLIHEDMAKNFSAYPKKWGLTRPDSNIDHRRVENIHRFLTRTGKALSLSTRPADYKAGDIVTWKLKSGRPHIGVVSDKTDRSGRPLVIHNIGRGARLEDVLFAAPITGHFRFWPNSSKRSDQ